MALSNNDFEAIKNESNMKICKSDSKKFLFDFRLNGKRYRKVFTIPEQINWDKRTYIKEAKKELTKYMQEIDDGYKITHTLTLDKFFNEHYIKTLHMDKRWTIEQIGAYNRYIKQSIGNKKLTSITTTDIKKIIATMHNRGLKPNTQKKVLQVLKPIFRTLVESKFIKDDPTMSIKVKLAKTKKKVTNATSLFRTIYAGILEYFQDNPFYQALFLFIIFGRRKSEVFNLKWENIDFNNNYYIIEDTKNNENQQFPLPDVIKTQLLLIHDDRQGLVFKSPVTGGKLIDIKRQVKGFRDFVKVPNFQFHYMRNVLVSMLAEQQTESITLSGVLGHNDPNTITKYLSLNYYQSGKIGLEKIKDVLVFEE